jgi:hypothetical protein
MPHDDTGTAERAASTLAELYPSVSFLVLAGITGAVVMPRRDGCTPACSEGHTYGPGCQQQRTEPPFTDEYHAAGVYCGESAHCTPPYPGALPGTPYDPAPTTVLGQAARQLREAFAQTRTRP